MAETSESPMRKEYIERGPCPHCEQERPPLVEWCCDVFGCRKKHKTESGALDCLIAYKEAQAKSSATAKLIEKRNDARKRREGMIKLREMGFTHKAIGDLLAISAGRVRQIFTEIKRQEEHAARVSQELSPDAEYADNLRWWKSRQEEKAATNP